MQLITPYHFTVESWSSEEMAVLIYVVKNLKKENSQSILKKLSTLSEDSAKKVLLELVQFQNILKIL